MAASKASGTIRRPHDSRALGRTVGGDVTDPQPAIAGLDPEPEPRPGPVLPAATTPPLVALALGTPQVQADAELGQQYAERRVDGRAQCLVEESPEVQPAEAGGEAFELSFGQAGAVFPSVFLPEDPHHGIQGTGTGRAVPDLEVQRQGHQGPLEVIADGRVRGVLVRAIELDPRVEAGLLQGLLAAPRGAVELGQGAPEQLEVLLDGDEPTAPEREVIVIGRDALEDPELAGIGLGPEVGAHELGRADALDVPGMEVLVADEAEEAPVPGLIDRQAGLGHVVPAAGERR